MVDYQRINKRNKINKGYIYGLKNANSRILSNRYFIIIMHKRFIVFIVSLFILGKSD